MARNDVVGLDFDYFRQFDVWTVRAGGVLVFFDICVCDFFKTVTVESSTHVNDLGRFAVELMWFRLAKDDVHHTSFSTRKFRHNCSAEAGLLLLVLDDSDCRHRF